MCNLKSILCRIFNPLDPSPYNSHKNRFFVQYFNYFYSLRINIWIVVQLKIDSSSNSQSFFIHIIHTKIDFSPKIRSFRSFFTQFAQKSIFYRKMFDFPDPPPCNSQKWILRPIFPLSLPSMINTRIIVQLKLDSSSNFLYSFIQHSSHLFSLIVSTLSRIKFNRN